MSILQQAMLMVGNASTVSDLVWRLYVSAVDGASDGVVIAELKFYDLSGAQIDTGTNRVANTIYSSYINASNYPWFVFDANLGVKWSSASSVPQWIGQSFATTTTVRKIKMVGNSTSANFPTYAPKDFKLQCAPTSGGTWVDVGSPVTGQTGWAQGEEREFIFQ